MTFVIAALAGGAKLHQHLALRRQLGHLQALAAVLGNGPVGDPDVAMTIHMQAVREYEQACADGPDRLTGLQIELNDRGMVRAVAAIGAATIDRPYLAVGPALNTGGRAPLAG